MKFIAMNRFKVRIGHESDFENIWKSRESRLKELDGFKEFSLLKGETFEDEGYTLYASHTIWAERANFEAWTKSEQFRDAHKDAGNSGTREALADRPQFEGFQAVLEEA